MPRMIGSISSNAFGIGSQAIQNLLHGHPEAFFLSGHSNTAHRPGRPPHETREPLIKFTRMLEQAAQQSRKTDLGLELASLPWRLGESVFGPVFSWAPNLRLALEIMVAHFEASQTRTIVRLFEQHGTAYFTYQVTDPSASGCLHDCVYTLGKLCHSIRRAIGPAWKPRHVAFTGSSFTGTAPYQKFFQAPVSFNSHFSGLCFNQSLLDQTIPTADARKLKDFCDQLQQWVPPPSAQPSFEAALTIWIGKAISKRDATLENAARAFGMSPRTFQRQLRNRGLGFQILLRQARLERAKVLLIQNPNLSISEIADELGFSETSAFTRIFQHHMHISPRAYRYQHDTRVASEHLH